MVWVGPWVVPWVAPWFALWVALWFALEVVLSWCWGGGVAKFLLKWMKSVTFLQVKRI